LHITVDGDQSLRAAHELTERVERAVEAILPGADVTVHPEPAPPARKSLPDQHDAAPG
jgi:divalent metal cation (Fe/Co/Zn/Cd) transporter